MRRVTDRQPPRAELIPPLRYSVSTVFPLPAEADVLFYDGHCGLCHRAVRFVLKRGRPGAEFRFAPLQGTTFVERIPAERRRSIPDSMAVLTAGGLLLTRADALIYILRRLGGGWQTVAAFAAAIPRPLRDALYDVAARARYRVFGRREEPCPVADPGLRRRFDP